MMRPSDHQSYVNPSYPYPMPTYWGGYPQDRPYYYQPVQPYPFQMAGDSVMQKQSGPQVYPFQNMQEQPMTIGPFPGAMMQHPYYTVPQAFAQPLSPFANPLQPQVKRPPSQSFANPYPQQPFMQKAQPSSIQSVLNQFKTQDGSMDVTKMMNTAGQMVNTVSQMTSVFKGVGGLFKLKG